MKEKQLCMNCMKDLGGYEVCMHCGWIEGTPPSELSQLYPKTMLMDRYLIGNCIGYGGFGITYRAWDTKLDMQVAVKEFFPSGLVNRSPGENSVAVYSGDRKQQFILGLDRFLAEARNMAKFSNNPNIVNVIDYFEANKTAYIVMEYLDGMNLKSYLNQVGGKLPVDKAVELIITLCDALKAVHKEGIIHRDISPDNIFITNDKRVKLIDFGAARLAQGEKEETLSVILKPGYAPPEQYRSKSKQGPFSDIYALGATLYRLVTGQVPDESVDRQVNDELVRPMDVNVVVPEYVDRAIMRAMALNSNLRFQNVQEFQQALAEKKTVTMPNDELKLRRKKRNLMSLVAGVVLFGVVLAVVLLNTVLKPVAVLNSKAIASDTIEIWIPDTSNDSDLTNQQQAFNYIYNVKDRFSIDNKQITTNIVTIPAAEYDAKLAEAFENYSAPDLYFVSNMNQNMSDHAADLTLLLNSFDQGKYLFLNNYDKWFAERKFMPLGFNVPVLFLNNYLFTDNGVTQPTGRLPMSQVYSVLNGISGVVAAPIVVSPLQYTTIAYSSGGKILRQNSSPFKAQYSATAADGLDLLQASYRSANISEATFNLFAQEQAACYLGDSSEFDKVQDALPGYYSVLPAPGDSDYVATFSDVWCVNKSSSENQQQAAMLFLLNLLGDNAQDEMCIQNDSALPINKNVFNDYITLKRPEMSFINDYLPVIAFFGEVQPEINIMNQTISDNYIFSREYDKSAMLKYMTGN